MKGWGRIKNIVSVIGLFMLGIAVLSKCAGSCDNSDYVDYQDNRQPDKDNTTDIEPKTIVTNRNKFSVTATAESLNSYYHDNEVIADNTCKGERIYLTGRIKSIQKDFLDQCYITLETGELFQSMTCYISCNAALYVKKGEKVELIGTCRGMVMGMVSLEDCDIIKSYR